MEIMVERHRITSDLANHHIEKMTDKDVEEHLEMYRKQDHAKRTDT